MNSSFYLFLLFNFSISTFLIFALPIRILPGQVDLLFELSDIRPKDSVISMQEIDDLFSNQTLKQMLDLCYHIWLRQPNVTEPDVNFKITPEMLRDYLISQIPKSEMNEEQQKWIDRHVDRLMFFLDSNRDGYIENRDFLLNFSDDTLKSLHDLLERADKNGNGDGQTDRDELLAETKIGL